MKKIIATQLIKTGHGTCDFCKKHDTDGFIGELKTTEAEYKEMVKVIDGWGID